MFASLARPTDARLVLTVASALALLYARVTKLYFVAAITVDGADGRTIGRAVEGSLMLVMRCEREARSFIPIQKNERLHSVLMRG